MLIERMVMNVIVNKLTFFLILTALLAVYSKAEEQKIIYVIPNEDELFDDQLFEKHVSWKRIRKTLLEKKIIYSKHLRVAIPS